jgi:hypothetical protein
MKYQLVIQFPYSSEKDYDNMIELENKLEEKIGENHIIDGHDIGSGEMNIFIHTDKPEEAFKVVRANLLTNEIKNIKAAYRPLAGENYEVIWPKGFLGKFCVK